MSSLRVNKIVNLNDNGPVEFTQGATVPSGYNIGGDGQVVINSSGIVTSPSLSITGNMNLTGVITATTFVGSGIGLTGVPGTPNGKGIAFTLIT